MSQRERSWQQQVVHAMHYKAIGETHRHLFEGTDDDRPWEHVVDIGDGGSRRLDISTSVRFTADHPSGLSFSWFVDIESRAADGKSHYEIDLKRIREVLARLPLPMRSRFKAHLSDAAAAVALKGREWQELADRQKRDAKALAELSC